MPTRLCFLHVQCITSFVVPFLQILLSAQEQGRSEENFWWTSEKVRFSSQFHPSDAYTYLTERWCPIKSNPDTCPWLRCSCPHRHTTFPIYTGRSGVPLCGHFYPLSHFLHIPTSAEQLLFSNQTFIQAVKKTGVLWKRLGARLRGTQMILGCMELYSIQEKCHQHATIQRVLNPCQFWRHSQSVRLKIQIWDPLSPVTCRDVKCTSTWPDVCAPMWHF